jgi:hypothetical protein
MNVPQMPRIWICTFIYSENRNALNTKGTKVHEGKAKARGSTIHGM